MAFNTFHTILRIHFPHDPLSWKKVRAELSQCLTKKVMEEEREKLGGVFQPLSCDYRRAHCERKGLQEGDHGLFRCSYLHTLRASSWKHPLSPYGNPSSSRILPWSQEVCPQQLTRRDQAIPSSPLSYTHRIAAQEQQSRCLQDPPPLQQTT